MTTWDLFLERSYGSTSTKLSQYNTYTTQEPQLQC